MHPIEDPDPFCKRVPKTGASAENGHGHGETSIDLARLKSYREEKIQGLRAGVEGLLRSGGVEVMKGAASFLSENRIGIENGHQFSLFEFKQAIVAIGGKMVYPSGISMKSPFILTEREALTMTEIPEELIVSGHDYVAIEIAAAYAALGSTVTLLMERRLPFDQAIEREMKRLLKKQKVSVTTEVTILSVSHDGGVDVDYESPAGTRQVHGTHLVLCGKSEADLSRAGLDRLSLECEGDKIKVDGEGRTSIPGVWAIGDVTRDRGLPSKRSRKERWQRKPLQGRRGKWTWSGFLPSSIWIRRSPVRAGLRKKRRTVDMTLSAVSILSERMALQR
ncbi:FAD-dependent oxidoreductase [Rossellomorea sp. H39__3]